MATDRLSPAREFISRIFRAPGRTVELVCWALLVAAIAWPRVCLWQKLPAYLWSKDAYGYCEAVFNWMDTGAWQSDPRRGPVYSALIAAALKLWGSFDALIVLQHVLGGLAVLGAVVILRVMHGARALIPVVACGYAYAVYAGPISMGHLVRNETLLLVFATGALGGFFLALRTKRAAWLAVAGVSAGLLSITKNVFAPFPPLTLATLLWLNRRDWRAAAAHAAVFAVAFALPLVGGKIEKRLSANQRPPEPQAGLLLFARVAQFTVLDGGVEPEMKALIRDDILAYKKQVEEEDDLDNNIVLNRTAVPRMRKFLLAQGKTPSDLNRICRNMAVEAIKAHPREYFGQFLGDLWNLHRKYGSRMDGPGAGDVRGSVKFIGSVRQHPAMRVEETVKTLQERTDKKHFKSYVAIVDTAWLFQLWPVLITSLALPFMILRNRGETRWFWLVCAALWYFTIILLSTIGKPLHRYLLPVTPVMFWTLSSVVIYAWERLARLAGTAASRTQP
jgi:4-amino-4-deoxy-L-arabinose transferase-like glycosyltransferase